MSKILHATFFPLMSALRLLDLSTSTSSVLHELPTEIGQLINLEYLNLSNTAIPDRIATYTSKFDKNAVFDIKLYKSSENSRDNDIKL